MTDERSEPREIERFDGQIFRRTDDDVTREEPLEIRVEGRSVAVIMRTPGDDLDLARGFLLTEGIVREPGDVFEITQCPSESGGTGNVLNALLVEPEKVDLGQLSRHVFTSSSCGLCGRATIDNVLREYPPVSADWTIAAEILLALPAKLRAAQETFSKTGGLHASALFDREGNLLDLREDVGRHNALDKIIGAAWERGALPLREAILLVSGRVSFELTQKALIAGIPLIAGISAPSTLAIDCAERGRQTLIGFLRERTMNVYAGRERIA